MKATEGTIYRALQGYLDDQTSRLEDLRKIAASGKRMSKPSDDPAAVRPLMSAKQEFNNAERYISNMGQSLDKMSSMETHMDQIENTLQRVQEIAINSINSSLDPATRQMMANELGQLREQLLDSANAQVDGRYIFGGYEEQTAPFSLNGAYVAGAYDPTNAATWPYTYNGDANATSLAISTGEQIQVNFTGAHLFHGDANNDGNVDAGQVNIFAVVTNLMESVTVGDTVTTQAEMANLEIAADQNRSLHGLLGNRMARIETSMAYQEDIKVDLLEVISRYEDADAIEAFNNMLQQETALEAALSVTSRVSQLSILDFIR